MGLFEGKTTTERNKLIAAGVLGVVALLALYFAFGRGLFSGSSTTATVKVTATPKPTAVPGAPKTDTALPTADEQNFVYQSTVVDYHPGSAGAPDAGRNIFAFYEPPPPTPYVPTPAKTPTPGPPPTAAPTPPILIASANPQNIYAGSPSFRLELGGDRFTPDAHIYFNQTEMPTTFVTGQSMFTDIPANLIAQEGQKQVIVQTPDGKLYSNQVMINVQPPPKPGYTYIGMIARKRYNNDTAYFTEQGKDKPFGARLNDVLGGRFRLVDISAAEVVFEDTGLGFKHRLAISRTTQGGTGTGVGPGGQPPRFNPNDGSFQPFDPNMTNIPGIPNNIPRYIPPQDQKRDQKPDEKADVDDNGDN